MIILKKLAFAPLFLILFTFLSFKVEPLLSSYDVLFSLSLQSLIELVAISFLVLLTSISFVLFATLSLDLKYILPVTALAILIPLVKINPNIGLFISSFSFVAFTLTYFSLDKSLKSYLTFSPNSILGPSVRLLSVLLILSLSITYFLSVNKIILEKGFQIPDSLIESSLRFAPIETPSSEERQPAEPQISQEQIELLRQNPQLLKQYGLDPAILDSFDKPTPGSKPQTISSQDIVKAAVKSQLDSALKPYLGFIPVALAAIFYLTLISITSLLNIFIAPLITVIFYILEKTNYIKFTKEMREVKKMVV